MGRNNLPSRINLTVNMSISDLYSLLSPLYPGPSDPHRLIRVSPAPSDVNIYPADVPSQRSITSMNPPDFPSTNDSHSTINVSNWANENPLDLTSSPSPAVLEETPPLRPLERPTPTASTSSASTSTTPPSIPVDYPLFHRLVTAMETIATHAAHMCSCNNAPPDSSSTSPPLSNPSDDTNIPAIPADMIPRRNSVEDVINNVATDINIQPAFRLPHKRPAQHHKHVSSTRATGRPPKCSRR